MLKHYKRVKNAKEVGVDEFFAGTVIKPVANTQKERGFFRSSAFIIKNLVALVVLSVIAGGLIAVPAFMAASQVAIAADPIADHWKNLPDELGDIEIGTRNVLYDKNGDVFAEVWSENRIVLKSLDEISDYAIDGLIATEDKRFFSHGGIDLMGTSRAALSGSGGGSGITQQLVKNLQFYNMAGKDKKDEAVEGTIERKIKELKLAMGYENTHSKNEILLSYFNTVAFGAPTVYSIESASQYFFGKKAKDLSLAQASVLVGSVQNPVKYNLNNKDNKDGYKARQKAVLNRMVAGGYITQQEADKAYKAKLKMVFKKTSNGNCSSSKFPFYCDYVIDYMKSSPKLAETEEEREAIFEKGGLHIKTYLDPAGMKAAEKQLKDDYGNDNRVVVPIAVVEPGTGGVSVIAMNRKYGEGKGQTTLNLPLNPSGTGSTYKMITLAAALNNGFTEDSLAFSSACPLYPGPNYDSPKGGFRNSSSCKLQGGFLDYKQATAYSSNTWFVTLEMKVTVEKIKEFSRSVGLSAPDNISNRSLSYTLGTSENSPVDMAAAFATFANQGAFCPATPVVSYAYVDGTSPVVPETYDAAADSCRRVMSPHNAGIVLKAMRANVSGEVKNAFGLKFNVPGYETVAKSGTNELYNSAWVQLTGNYSMFINMYDPVRFVNGIDYVRYQGRSARWFEHASAFSARDIFKKILDTNGYEKLDYDNPDRSVKAIPVEKRDFFTVPSVIGITPSEALNSFESLGLTVNVSKETVEAPEGFPVGVVVEQSIEPGTQLPVGSKKEVVLYISE